MKWVKRDNNIRCHKTNFNEDCCGSTCPLWESEADVIRRTDGDLAADLGEEVAQSNKGRCKEAAEGRMWEDPNLVSEEELRKEKEEAERYERLKARRYGQTYSTYGSPDGSLRSTEDLRKYLRQNPWRDFLK